MLKVRDGWIRWEGPRWFVALERVCTLSFMDRRASRPVVDLHNNKEPRKVTRAVA